MIAAILDCLRSSLEDGSTCVQQGGSGQGAVGTIHCMHSCMCLHVCVCVCVCVCVRARNTELRKNRGETETCAHHQVRIKGHKSSVSLHQVAGRVQPRPFTLASNRSSSTMALMSDAAYLMYLAGVDVNCTSAYLVQREHKQRVGVGVRPAFDVVPHKHLRRSRQQAA